MGDWNSRIPGIPVSQGDVLGYRISPIWGWDVFGVWIPRAMPWAITFRPFGAGEDIGVWIPRAMPWAIAFRPFGAGEDVGVWIPRAMPWAITFRPFGADGRKRWGIFDD